MKTFNSHRSYGFTIVELLVVIVVIGILAAITIVAYTGITQRATIASLQSDLDNASKQLKMYYTEYSSYPTVMTGNCPTSPVSDTKYCLKPSSGATFTYTNLLGTSFKLIATKDSTSYYITSDISPNNKNLLYLLTGDMASFEDGSTGGWADNGWGNTIYANSVTQAYHQTHSLKMTLTGSGYAADQVTVTSVTSANAQYTGTAKVKGSIGAKINIFIWDSIGADIHGTEIVADGSWQTITVTATFSTGTSRVLGIRSTTHNINDIIYADAIQLESGSIATPF